MKVFEEEVYIVNHFNDKVGKSLIEVFESEGKYKLHVDGEFKSEINDNTMMDFVNKYINNQGYYVTYNCNKFGSEHIISKPSLIHLVRCICKLLNPIEVLHTSTYYFNHTEQLLMEV